MKNINENRPGYKKTKVEWIPEDWKVNTLGECCIGKGRYGINAPSVGFSSELPTYLRITDINDYGRYKTEEKVSVNNSESKNYYLEYGDLIFVRTGSSTGKTYLYNPKDGQLVYAGFLIKFTTNRKKLLSLYLKHFTESNNYYKWIQIMSMRSGQPGINSVEYSNLIIPLPPLPEQKKIAAILSTWDKAIEKMESLIEAKKKCKKRLMQQFLGGKTRFYHNQHKKRKTKIGFLPYDWKCVAFSSVSERIIKPIKVQPNNEYKEIGIRSHGKGIFHKLKVIGKQLGNKRVFKIEIGAIVFNIVFAWEQAVAIISEKENGFIASHRFPMYKSKNEEYLEEFLLLFFLSKRGKYVLELASPGGAGRNKTLGQNELNYLYIPLPSIEEQKSIVECIKVADKEINLNKQELEKLKEQKKGLMQVLLTGNIRVKV